MLLSAKNITYSYPSSLDQLSIFSPVSFKISSGNIYCLTGSNGSGKTTILKILNGDLVPLSGIIEVTSNLKRIYMDQDISDFVADNLTVREHLSIQKHGEHIDSNILNPEIEKILRHASLLDSTDKFVGELSGGQRQIIALICVITGGYNLLLLDEFTAHMDKKSTEMAWNILANYIQMKNAAIVYVDHTSKQLTLSSTKIIVNKKNYSN